MQYVPRLNGGRWAMFSLNVISRVYKLQYRSTTIFYHACGKYRGLTRSRGAAYVCAIFRVRVLIKQLHGGKIWRDRREVKNRNGRLGNWWKLWGKRKQILADASRRIVDSSPQRYSCNYCKLCLMPTVSMVR